MTYPVWFIKVSVILLLFLTSDTNCMLGSPGDERCYMKKCEISLATRDNSSAAKDMVLSVERSLGATVSGCGAEIQKNVTMEVKRSHTGIGGGIVNFVENAIGSVNTIKGDLMAAIRQGCGAGFQLTEIRFIHVELDIFSGVENPRWTLSASDDDFVSVKEMLAFSTSSQIPTRAGYRGFTVLKEMVDGTVTLQTFGQGLQNSTDLEILLLHSNTANLDPTLVLVALYGINGQVPASLPTPGTLPLYPDPDPDLSSRCDSGLPCTALPYGSQSWSSNLSRLGNSCYNYASGRETNTLAQPGRGSGSQYDNLSGVTIRNSAVHDGFEDRNDTAQGQFPDTNSCLVALVGMENLDFHFYRQDKDGMWSHKLGTHAPTNLDNNGQIITDPRTANIGPYHFVRFLSYCRRNSNLHIK